MIGTWQDSAKLGGVGVSLWVVAYGWYFLGTHRIIGWWWALLAKLGVKPAAAEKPAAKKRRRAG